MLNPELLKKKKIKTRIEVLSPVGNFISEVVEWGPDEWEQMELLLENINNMKNFSFPKKGFKDKMLHFGPELLKNSVITVEML